MAYDLKKEMANNKTKFYQTMNYPSMLMSAIADVKVAMMSGGDGVSELSNLISLLYEEAYNPISQQITDITTELDIKVNEVRNQTLPENWSEGHKLRYLNQEAHRHNIEASRRIINIIVNRLFKMGLLIESSSAVAMGGEVY